MTLSVGIAFGALTLSLCMLALAFANFILMLTRDEEKKRGRIYERIDETKKTHDGQMKEVQDEIRGEFVLKDLCLLQHENIGEILKEVKNDMKFIVKTLTEQKG